MWRVAELLRLCFFCFLSSMQLLTCVLLFQSVLFLCFGLQFLNLSLPLESKLLLNWISPPPPHLFFFSTRKKNTRGCSDSGGTSTRPLSQTDRHTHTRYEVDTLAFHFEIMLIITVAHSAPAITIITAPELMRADVSARDGRLEELRPLPTLANNGVNSHAAYQSSGAFGVPWLLVSPTHFYAGAKKEITLRPGVGGGGGLKELSPLKGMLVLRDCICRFLSFFFPSEETAHKSLSCAREQ